ncbi:MAG: DNA-3-methyladenine glycosylase 2 family protein [Bacilli bacterium]|nr:DNA-3-methyladenine glycosylase 2 family protein [Bacilli bacterium]
MIKIKNTDINLKDTITCGQIFRFKEEDDNSYTVILSDRVVNIKQDKNNLIVKSNKEDDLENVIRKYLDLDRDYNELNKKIIEYDNTLGDIISVCNGLKMINQPKFECIISYIISQNNRVSQIAKTLNNISEKYGEKVNFEGKEYYLFPSLKEIKNCTKDELRELKTGFRDEYIYEFINKVNNGEFDINQIDDMTSDNAMSYLIENKGIGEKVASCILLFGYSRYDVFPVDTWVKKYMKDIYNITNIKDIRKFTKEKYKDYSGLVIQYMFHYKRNGEKK